MENPASPVQTHYHRDGLYEAIISILRQQGYALDHITRGDIAGADEFHVRGAAVSKELAAMVDLRGLKVLDVGCGIGGPCRMLAEAFNCNVTGIDLNHEFIRTAKALSLLVKPNQQITFLQGDATSLPFEDNAFDAVWTQHVQMNIADKQKLYTEIHRVLKPGGYFLYYDILRKTDEEVTYPMPWADDPAISYLFTSGEMHAILTGLGFSLISSADQTKAGISFLENSFVKMEQSSSPMLNLSVLMGTSAKIKLTNLKEDLDKGILMLGSGIYQRMG